LDFVGWRRVGLTFGRLGAEMNAENLGCFI
jgi:hypothetical protein